MKNYTENIIKETQKNTYFRKVVFTGEKNQLVVMDIKPGEDIGEEIHKYTEQVLFLLSGTGKSVIDGVEQLFQSGDIAIVLRGIKHNFINTGDDSLKICTIYTPPHHLDGRVHVTKKDADADTEDEEFGEKEPA